jgi:hypothetical protein
MSAIEMKKELKSILCGYRVFNSSIEKRFRELGFISVRDKNHIILQYKINGKIYKFTMSKTASDFRAGYKQAGVIYRTLKNEFIA